MAPFLLSIEPIEGTSFIHGFHLGTDERDARVVAEDIFRNRKWWPRVGNITVRTVALFRDGKMFDCYDGTWASEIGFDIPTDEEQERLHASFEATNALHDVEAYDE